MKNKIRKFKHFNTSLARTVSYFTRKNVDYNKGDFREILRAEKVGVTGVIPVIFFIFSIRKG
ncbi:MAG: hypothetical protein FWF51_11735 [Chitinivibrionia bacterium]|nr:hypothetical protein [Chitinivibrionia bacterium]